MTLRANKHVTSKQWKTALDTFARFKYSFYFIYLSLLCEKGREEKTVIWKVSNVHKTSFNQKVNFLGVFSNIFCCFSDVNHQIDGKMFVLKTINTALTSLGKRKQWFSNTIKCFIIEYFQILYVAAKSIAPVIAIPIAGMKHFTPPKTYDGKLMRLNLPLSNGTPWLISSQFYNVTQASIFPISQSFGWCWRCHNMWTFDRQKCKRNWFWCVDRRWNTTRN